jgi:hypothetical protein
MKRNSPPNAASSSWRRAIVPLALLAGLLVYFAANAGSAVAAEERGDWESPLPASALVQPEGEERFLARAETRLDGEPLELEVELSALALLEAETGFEGDGPGHLLLTSRQGQGLLPCRGRFVAGPAAGREFGSEGRCELRGLPKGTHLLELRAGGLRTERLIRVRDQREEQLRIVWVQSGVLRGRVFGFDGQPLAKATVELASASAQTAADGSFELRGLVPGPGQPLKLRAPGHAVQFESVHVPKPDEAPRELRFVLPAGRTIHGVVHLPANELADARLAALPIGSGAARTPWFWERMLSDIELDARGQFRIEHAPLGSFELGLAHPRYVLREPVIVQETHQQRSLHVLPERCHVLRGVVRDEDGKALPGASIAVREGRRAFPAWGPARIAQQRELPLPASVAAMGLAFARSDAQGQYAVGLPWTSSFVEVAAAGHTANHERVTARRDIRRDFELEASNKMAGEHRLVLLFDEALGRPLAIRVLDGEVIVAETQRHDPAAPFVIPLQQAARMRVALHSVAAESVELHEVPVMGTRSLRVALPGKPLQR